MRYSKYKFIFILSFARSYKHHVATLIWNVFSMWLYFVFLVLDVFVWFVAVINMNLWGSGFPIGGCHISQCSTLLIYSTRKCDVKFLMLAENCIVCPIATQLFHNCLHLLLLFINLNPILKFLFIIQSKRNWILHVSCLYLGFAVFITAISAWFLSLYR